MWVGWPMIASGLAMFVIGLLIAEAIYKGGENIMFEELFGTPANYLPKSTLVAAYTLQADIATPSGIVSAGSKFAKINGTWTFVDPIAWAENYDPEG